MRNLAESLLALFAGSARAAAIYGDLVELSATRGRLWFFATYTRTLLSLTWRTPVAFLCGVGVFDVAFPLFQAWMHHMPHAWRTRAADPLLTHMGPGLALATLPLWFAVPYAFIRYGLRDRVAQLLCVVSLGATLALLYIPWLSTACAVATALLVAGALLSANWRRPMAILVVALGAGSATLAGSAVLFRTFAPRSSSANGTLTGTLEIATTLAMFALAFVLARLHRRLLETAETGKSAAA